MGPLEGVLSSNQGKQNNTQREDIHILSDIGLLIENFRSDIDGSAFLLCQEVFRKGGKSEISKLKLIVFID